MENKVGETIGDVSCPTCRNEKCVYISTKNTTIFHDCKNCKACCNVLNMPFKEQKPTFIMFGGDGTSSREVSRSDEWGGDLRFLCIKIGYSEPTRAGRREGTSTLVESSRVRYYSILNG